MGDVDMLGKATAAVAGRLRGDGLERAEVLARAALEAAGVLGPDAQPPPQPRPGEPSMHDLVVAVLEGWRDDSTWRPAVERAQRQLTARKAFGLAKYGTLLQVFGPRSSTADLADELADAVVYAQQGLERSLAGNHAGLAVWWRRRRDTALGELVAVMEVIDDGQV